MSRRDLQLDAMLRHLGATYYQAVHAEGSAIAVERALESVDDARRSGGTAGSELAETGARARSHRGGRWRVRDVMSTDVEADVLRKEERRFRWLARGVGGGRDRAKAEARTAGELMTSPVITTHPDASLASAARLMNDHHIRRLPVLDGSGKLI